MSRADEVAAGLDRVRRRIDAACAAADRDPGEVTLIVITKFFPVTDVRLLADLGVRHVGENRHQEAKAKKAECEALGLTWHFVGGLQSNKAAAVAAWADVVHSVDRAKLLGGLSRAASDKDRPLDVLIQVSLDPPDQHQGRNGVDPEAAAELATTIDHTEGLGLRGVMGVAPLDGDPVHAFDLLARTAADVRAAVPHASWVSAGMSDDLEPAIAAGATHVRIGSAVLGNRPRGR